MSKFYRFLWSLAILFILVTTVVFSMGIILVGAIGASVFGIYRYYLTKKRTREGAIKPYISGEVIDIKSK
ncbi:MAG TPA: hypothetical protein VN456_09500 [Desulfosporosinus sp.]|nr:hypothetical protein [Desulfosporosinus sp.]